MKFLKSDFDFMNSQFPQFFSWVSWGNTALVQDKAFCLAMEGRSISQDNTEVSYLSIESIWTPESCNLCYHIADVPFKQTSSVAVAGAVIGAVLALFIITIFVTVLLTPRKKRPAYLDKVWVCIGLSLFNWKWYAENICSIQEFKCLTKFSNYSAFVISGLNF